MNRLFSVFNQIALALQGEVAGDGVGAGVKAPQRGDAYAVACLFQQLLLGVLAGFQIHGEGADAHGAVVACLGGVAGGGFSCHGGGLQVIQQGFQLAPCNDVFPAGGVALGVEGHGHGAVLVEGVVHQGHYRRSNDRTFLACQTGKTLLGGLGGEYAGEGGQQVAHGLAGEHHRADLGLGHLADQLLLGGIYCLGNHSLGIQGIQLAHLELVVVLHLLSVGHHGADHQGGQSVFIGHVQPQGVADGGFHGDPKALGGTAVHHHGVGGVELLLGGEHRVNESLGLGEGVGLPVQGGVGLAALHQEHLLLCLQSGGVVHGPLHNGGGLLRGQGLGGGVAHLAVYNATEAHAPLQSGRKFVDFMLECADGGGCFRLVVQLVMCQTHSFRFPGHKVLEFLKFHCLSLLICRLR